jgi:hypothetical protein
MSRQFKLKDPSWGEHDILVIHEDDEGVWPDEWIAFQTDPEVSRLGALFSRVTQEAYQDALRNYPTRLIKELGLPPLAWLIKAPSEMKQCAFKRSCAMYDKGACQGDNNKVPVCYQAALEEAGVPVEIQVSRVFELWRLGFYIIVVPTSDH